MNTSLFKHVGENTFVLNEGFPEEMGFDQDTEKKNVTNVKGVTHYTIKGNDDIRSFTMYIDLLQGIHINRLYLRKYGQGIGSNILTKVKALADKLNLPVTVDALPHIEGRMEDLHRFYEKNGFVKEGPLHYGSQKFVYTPPEKK